MKRLLLTALVITSGCLAPDLQIFDVTIRTVRNCHPAGLFPELCEARSQFEGIHRTARFTLEMRGPTQFILYEDDGRALPGNVERGEYFARSLHQEISANGCQKQFERSVKFEIRKDMLPTIPGRQRRRDRMVGSAQSRTSQNGECGQAAASKFEEVFDGEEVREDDPTLPFPTLPLVDGGAS
ncbi:MAG: hypothetical protein AB2A00_16190 [Myxococcota bacterium]